MIPVLFESTETKFDTSVSNGLGRLYEATSCICTEKRNGEYYLTMEYPFASEMYKYLEKGRYILAEPSSNYRPQPFEIDTISRPMGGIVTVTAWHISDHLRYIPVMPFTASSCADALNKLKTYSSEPNPFTVWTDKNVTASFTNKVPRSFKACLGGEENSLLDVYGTAEYEFDMYNVKMHLHRGKNRGVTVRYGVNLKDLKQEDSIANTVTGITPYWHGTIDQKDVTVVLPEKNIQSDKADRFPYHRTEAVDLSSVIKLPEKVKQPTVEMLREAAKTYMKGKSYGVPDVSLTVSYEDLAGTEEYSSDDTLQVNLCDTITVIFENLNVNATAEVISVEYDVLKEAYTKLELGSYKDTLSKIIYQSSIMQNNLVSAVQTIESNSSDTESRLIAEYVKQNQIILDDTKATTDALSKKIDDETTRATNAENANNKLITDHKADTNNPHKVTKSQVGLGNVDNTSDANKPISTAVQNALNNKVTKSNTADTNGLLNSLATEESTPTDADYYISQHAGGGTTTVTYHRRPMSALWAFIKSKCDSIYATVSTVNAHIANKSNPHGVTKSQVGLGNVDNTADSAKSVKYAASAGSANSVAWGNVSGKPSTYPPSSHTHTKDQVGLSNVDNTADSAKSVKYATSAGSANSVAWGNVSGKPSTYPPSSHTHTKDQVGLGNVDNTSDANKHVRVNNLQWGGNNIVSDISPLDVATSNLFAGNIMAYSNTSGITVEYSNDGAATWKDYGADNDSKTRLVTPETGTAYYYIGKKSTAQTATKDLLRITLDARKMGIYCQPRNLLINISSSGANGCYVNLEYSLRTSDTTFHDFGKYTIAGWSGWNSIPINTIPTGVFGTNGNDNQAVKIRLTFGFTGYVSGYGSKAAFAVLRMSMSASNRWTIPSSIGSVNAIYTLDVHKNATFPATVSAASFSGSLSGNASTATKATQDSSGQQINSTYIKSLSVSGRTITYTRGDGTTGTITTQDTNTNTTYTLTKSGSTITLTGSDGSKTSVTDATGNNASAMTNATIDSICV